MSPPVSFSDEQLDQLTAAARPLPPSVRSEFLVAVAKALEGREVGAGAIHRVVVALQREFMSGRRGEPHRRRAE